MIAPGCWGSGPGSPPVVTLLTRVEVDAADPAASPAREIYRVRWAAEEQSALEACPLWLADEKDGDHVRRVVLSPRPQKIPESGAISQLLADGNVGDLCGRRHAVVVEETAAIRGMEAVVDKDLAASVLAQSLAG